MYSLVFYIGGDAILRVETTPYTYRAGGTDLFRVLSKSGGKGGGGVGARICESSGKEKIAFVLNRRIKCLWIREVFRLDCRFDNFTL